MYEKLEIKWIKHENVMHLFLVLKDNDVNLFMRGVYVSVFVVVL